MVFMQIVGRPEPNIKINFLNSVELERSVHSIKTKLSGPNLPLFLNTIVLH